MTRSGLCELEQPRKAFLLNHTSSRSAVSCWCWHISVVLCAGSEKTGAVVISNRVWGGLPVAHVWKLLCPKRVECVTCTVSWECTTAQPCRSSSNGNSYFYKLIANTRKCRFGRTETNLSPKPTQVPPRGSWSGHEVILLCHQEAAAPSALSLVTSAAPLRPDHVVTMSATSASSQLRVPFHVSLSVAFECNFTNLPHSLVFIRSH